jgi:hypothetical protein
MRPAHPLLLSLALGIPACGEPFPCNRYCWSHQQLVADATSEALVGVPDGRFDDTCLTFTEADQWYPVLPPFGWYAAERCVPADEHEVIARTVTSIRDPAVDANQACDVTDLQIYADFVQNLALQARDTCVAHLTCNGAPAGCDLDPTVDENQACTVATAEILCDQDVLAPALAALTDLANGPGAAQPQRDGVVIEYVDDPQQCSPILQADTEGTPGCEEGGGDGLDESGSSGSDGGADESGGGSSESGESGGSMVEPFGEIGALVRCTAPRTCVVEPELFAAVESNFGIFVDEGLRLEVVAMAEIGAGVRISGLDRAEASGRLLRALGIEEGDVLMDLDGASIVAPETLEALMLELPTARSWRLTLRRRVSGAWETVVVTISRE